MVYSIFAITLHRKILNICKMKKGIVLAFAMLLTAWHPVSASITDLDIEKSEGGKSNIL